MIHKYLSELAEIITGYTFRKDTKLEGEAVKLLQAKNVRNELIITGENLDSISLDLTNLNAVAKNGDMILTSRSRFRAAIVKSEQPIIVSSSAYIIRPKSTEIDSLFMAIYLNSNQGQNELTKISSGNYIESLLKSHLVDLPIPLPSLSKQKQIVNLFQNIQTQKSLLKNKTQLITNISEGVLARQIHTS